MSLSAAASQLSEAVDEFLAHWERTTDTWRDSRRQEFQKLYVDPLKPATRSALDGIEHLRELIAAARRECG